MGDIKLPDEALKTAIEIVKQPVGNILSEPTKETGTGIASIVNLVFSPFKYYGQKANYYFAHKLEMYEKELEEKEKSIPEDKRVEPDFHTVSMALENSKFCITNDDIRRMFVNLIGCTLNSDTKDKAHPSLAETIKQMNSIDAHLLKLFSKSAIRPVLEIRRIENKGYVPVYSNLFINEDENHFSLDQLVASISNLNRLGLISVDYTSSLVKDSAYDTLQKIADNLVDIGVLKDMKFSYQKGVAALTPYGKNLVSICLPDL